MQYVAVHVTLHTTHNYRHEILNKFVLVKSIVSEDDANSLLLPYKQSSDLPPGSMLA